MAGMEGRDNELRGRRALVMGLGTRQGGLGVARYLVAQGAEVTVTDLRTADALRPALDALGDLPVRLRLGEHRREDFEQAEIVVRNPGVPADSEWLALARASGARIEMEMSLFFRACPAPIIGITGTKGKTSTATLCHQILRRLRSDSVLAGNMGRSALDALPEIDVDTPVVLELSSWQLEGLVEYEMSPQIAVLTNISEDHLNRYQSYRHYIEAKYQIARFQSSADWLVLNRDDALAWDARTVGSAQVVPFGSARAQEARFEAVFDDEHLIWRANDAETALLPRAALPLAGTHALYNALAASAAALLTGAERDHVRTGLAEAEGVPHRQELVATIDGVHYINDTAATAPAAAVAALDTYGDAPIVLIAGGAGKQVRLDAFARRAAERADAIVLLQGDVTDDLRRLIVDAGARRVAGPYGSMEEAVQVAAGLANGGGIVLLSPGCASFGLFRDEFHRGDAFRAAVGGLAAVVSGEGR